MHQHSFQAITRLVQLRNYFVASQNYTFDWSAKGASAPYFSTSYTLVQTSSLLFSRRAVHRITSCIIPPLRISVFTWTLFLSLCSIGCTHGGSTRFSFATEILFPRGKADFRSSRCGILWTAEYVSDFHETVLGVSEKPRTSYERR